MEKNKYSNSIAQTIINKHFSANNLDLDVYVNF